MKVEEFGGVHSVAKEKRLIDANALLISETFTVSEGACKECENEYRWAIQEAPTVDAVEVVRCKDCKHYVDGPYDNGDMMCDCWGEWIFPNDDDFCSCGERKDNG